MEYYPLIKRNELLIQAATWVNFQRIMRRKKNHHSPKVTYHMIPFIHHSWTINNQIIEKEKLLVVSRSWGRVRVGGSEHGYKMATWEILVVMEMFYILTIQISIFNYSGSKCYHWEKPDKGYIGSLCIMFYNWMWIYNYFKIKANF